MRARYGLSFVDSASDWYPASVVAIIYAISYYFGPRYNHDNGTRLHYDTALQWQQQNRNQTSTWCAGEVWGVFCDVITKHSPYLACMAKLWGVCCEDLGENWPCYNAWHCTVSSLRSPAGINLGVRSSYERRHYIVTLSPIGWAHTQKDPWPRNTECIYCGTAFALNDENLWEKLFIRKSLIQRAVSSSDNYFGFRLVFEIRSM